MFIDNIVFHARMGEICITIRRIRKISKEMLDASFSHKYISWYKLL